MERFPRFTLLNIIDPSHQGSPMNGANPRESRRLGLSTTTTSAPSAASSMPQYGPRDDLTQVEDP